MFKVVHNSNIINNTYFKQCCNSCAIAFFTRLPWSVVAALEHQTMSTSIFVNNSWLAMKRAVNCAAPETAPSIDASLIKSFSAAIKSSDNTLVLGALSKLDNKVFKKWGVEAAKVAGCIEIWGPSCE